MASASKRLRVLIIVENLSVPFDRRVWQEARALRDAGHIVSIICPKGEGFHASIETIEQIDIYRYPLPVEADGQLGYIVEYGWSLLTQFWYSCRVAFGKGFDVVHACNPPDNIFMIGGFFKIFGKRFLFDHHDLNPELYFAKFGKYGFAYRLLLWLERLTFKTADVSIATNESYKRIAIERGGMSPDKVFVVRSGPDLSRLKIVPPVDAHKHGRKYLVGYVGVMGKQEGIDYLLRSVRYIVHDLGREDIHFVLIGGGTELAILRDYSRELCVDEYVTFTGRVSDEMLVEVLCTADVCVNPDVANEMNDKSTMNKIMEYMALGKPIVQFDLAEGRVSAEEASLYAAKNDECDMAEKIVELLADDERRASMGAFGRRRVENDLEWSREVPKLLAAYDALAIRPTKPMRI